MPTINPAMTQSLMVKMIDSSQVLDGRNDDSNDSTLVLKENRVEPNEESVTNENDAAALDFTPVVHCDMESIPNDNGNEPYPLK